MYICLGMAEILRAPNDYVYTTHTGQSLHFHGQKCTDYAIHIIITLNSL